jgi:general secretion pathway protein D
MKRFPYRPFHITTSAEGGPLNPAPETARARRTGLTLLHGICIWLLVSLLTMTVAAASAGTPPEGAQAPILEAQGPESPSAAGASRAVLGEIGAPGAYGAEAKLNVDGLIGVSHPMPVWSQSGSERGDSHPAGGSASGAAARPASSARTAAALVTIDPISSTLESGDAFTVSVVISDATNLGAFEFEMAYNPKVIQAESAVLGPFLGSSGRNAFPLGPTIRNETGWLRFGAFSFGMGSGPSGGGILAELVLTGRGAGMTALDLQSVQVLSVAGDEQPSTVVDGHATVEGKLWLPFVLRE